jgi:hypothetical protein
VKFLCIECDEQMQFEERQEPGDGTFAASFTCGSCGRRIALLANPMETQLVGALGVKIGGRELDEPAMALIQRELPGSAAALGSAPVPVESAPLRPRWDDASLDRLARVPTFVRGMVKRIYADYAAERGIVEITPAVMDRARTELGLEGM